MTQGAAFGVADSIGKRKVQEDFVRWAGMDEEAGERGSRLPPVIVIADGMGGHAAGDVASRLATAAFLDACVARTQGEPDLLGAALESANDQLARYVADHPEAEGMGCTLIAIEVREGGGAYRWISVGDSLLLSVSPTGIQRLNDDHSFRPEIARATEAGETIENLPSGNVLRSAVMGVHIPLIDDHAAWRTFAPDETLVLATDGLDTLPLDEIATIVRSADDATAIAEALVVAVENAGKPRQDNTTVAVLKGPAVSATPAAPPPASRSARPARARAPGKARWTSAMLLAMLAVGLALGAVAVWGAMTLLASRAAGSSDTVRPPAAAPETPTRPITGTVLPKNGLRARAEAEVQPTQAESAPAPSATRRASAAPAPTPSRVAAPPPTTHPINLIPAKPEPAPSPSAAAPPAAPDAVVSAAPKLPCPQDKKARKTKPTPEDCAK